VQFSSIRVVKNGDVRRGGTTARYTATELNPIPSFYERRASPSLDSKRRGLRGWVLLGDFANWYRDCRVAPSTPPSFSGQVGNDHLSSRKTFQLHFSLDFWVKECYILGRCSVIEQKKRNECEKMHIFRMS